MRTYLFAGTQHTPGALPPLAADPNTGSRGLQRFNVVDYAPLLRAALVNLDRWVSEGVEPPASAFPRLADGTAVKAESLAAVFGTIPGVRFPDRIARPLHLDFGPDIERGIAAYPPKAGAPYRTYVSAVDADGNEVAGIRPPEARGAARDAHRLEPAPSRPGRAGRSHVDDGLDAAVSAHARGAREDRRSAHSRSRSATRRGRRTSRGCARPRRSWSRRDTCWPRTSKRSSSAREGVGLGDGRIPGAECRATGAAGE